MRPLRISPDQENLPRNQIPTTSVTFVELNSMAEKMNLLQSIGESMIASLKIWSFNKFSTETGGEWNGSF